MYFMYVDESGDSGSYTPGMPDQPSSHFILMGVIIRASEWRNYLSAKDPVGKEFENQSRRGDIGDGSFRCALQNGNGAGRRPAAPPSHSGPGQMKEKAPPLQKCPSPFRPVSGI